MEEFAKQYLKRKQENPEEEIPIEEAYKMALVTALLGTDMRDNIAKIVNHIPMDEISAKFLVDFAHCAPMVYNDNHAFLVIVHAKSFE